MANIFFIFKSDTEFVAPHHQRTQQCNRNK